MTVRDLRVLLNQERFDVKGYDVLVRWNGGELATPIVGLEIDTTNKVAYFDVAAEFGNGKVEEQG